MVAFEPGDPLMLFKRDDPKLRIETVQQRLLSIDTRNLYTEAGWAELKRRQPALRTTRNMQRPDLKIEGAPQGLGAQRPPDASGARAKHSPLSPAPSDLTTVKENIRSFLLSGCPTQPARLRVVRTNEATCVSLVVY